MQIFLLQDYQPTDFQKLINQIYKSELSLYEKYCHYKINVNQSIKSIRNLNQASLILKNLKDKKKFFSSCATVDKCYLSHVFTKNKKLKVLETPIFKRYAIISNIQKEIQKLLIQQTKRIVGLIKIKNESNHNEVTQKVFLTKNYLELKKLSHILTHILNLPCNYPKYHLGYDDTNNYFDSLIQESAIIFVNNWIQLNSKFVKKELPMPNAPILATLFINKIHFLNNLK